MPASDLWDLGDVRELVAAARAGDEHAFGLLWQATNPGLLRYLRVIAPARAEQLAAAAWREFVRSLRRVEPRNGTGAQWRCSVLSTARRLAAQGALALAPPPEAAGQPGMRLDEVVTDIALELMSALQPYEREVLVLRVACALSAAQVGQVTGLDQPAVRTIARTALARAGALASDPAVRRRIDRRAGAVEAAAEIWTGPMPSEDVYDELLAGRPARPGAAARTRLMAAIVAALAAPATSAELSGSGPAYAAYRRMIATGPRSGSLRLGSRIAVAAGVASIALSGALAAAYSGVLPDGLQQVAHDWLHAPDAGSNRPAVPDRSTAPGVGHSAGTVTGTKSAAHSGRSGGTAIGASRPPGAASGGAPGDTAEHVAPGSTRTPPGSIRTQPTQGNIPPGSTRTPPAGSKTAPGSTKTPPGSSKTPPGSSKTPPTGRSTPPGPTKTPPTGSRTPPSGTPKTPPTGSAKTPPIDHT